MVENRRLATGQVAQRTVLYLGEINDHQQRAWRKSIEVFDEERQQSHQISLFPEDRVIPEDAVDSLQVRLSGLQLRRPRAFGNCWLASELWHELGLGEFWGARLDSGREGVSWGKVLELSVVNRLIAPGSEFRLHREWFSASAMDELLGVDFAVAEKDRLYRCLDRLLPHKTELFVWLRQKWADLFQAEFEVLLYDLTSTCFEGEMEQNPKARRGYSRDGRPDCLQVVIGLVITTDGFPLAYEVMNGNTADSTTLRGFLERIEMTYGKAKRVWVMDRGIPTEAVRTEMRAMRRSLPARDQLLMRIGASKTEAGRAFGYVTVELPKKDEPVSRTTFRFRVDKEKLRQAELRDGHYLLRSNLVAEDPAVLWSRYIQLSAGDVEDPARGPRAGTDASSGVGQTGGHPDDRRMGADGGRPLADSAALHAAGEGPSTAAR